MPSFALKCTLRHSSALAVIALRAAGFSLLEPTVAGFAKSAAALSAPLSQQPRELLSPRGAFRRRKACVGQQHNQTKCFPDVMFVGQSKAGTTSISMYLINHPRIITQTTAPGSNILQIVKIGNKPLGFEVHIFDHHRKSAKALLEAHWHSCPLLHDDDVGDKLQLHYTPNYMYFPDAPFHIKRVYPNARSIKYIMMLRDPTKRAISSWEFHRRLTLELRTFEEAVEHGMRQRTALESCYKQELRESSTGAKLISELPEGLMEAATKRCFWDRIDTHDTTLPMELPVTLMHAHVDKSIYVDQLRRWFALLGQENFFVFSLEEWIKDPVGVFKDMLAFVGLDAVGPNGFASAHELNKTLSQRYNEDRGKLFHAPPKREVVDQLEAFFKPYNEELFALLGRKLW